MTGPILIVKNQKVTSLVLSECLPACLAVGKHTADSGHDDAGQRNATYNVPPFAVVEQIRNQAIDLLA